MPVPDDFLRSLESGLGLRAGSLRGDETLAEIDWDSLMVVMFIMMADEKYSIAVEPARLGEARTVADLYAIVAPTS